MAVRLYPGKVMGNNMENKENSVNAWEKVMQEYSRTGDPAPLAKMVAYSVIKKCLSTGYNSTLEQLRRELGRDLHELDTLHHASMNAYTATVTADGDYKRVKVDPGCAVALDRLASVQLGDGIDFVNVAVVAILEETAKQAEREPGTAVDLTRPYFVRRLSRKIWIKTEQSVNGWEEVETTPIREIYKAVRRYVMESRAGATDPRNGYSYLDETTTDPVTGEETTIYKRLPKYADLGGYAVDFNGACTLYSVERETVDRYESMVASLNLTAKQAQILSLKQSGYGNKAIATYMGISENSVKGACTEIKRKAAARFPAELLEKYVK